jgi:DNA-binding XRE family transcriptional regulator
MIHKSIKLVSNETKGVIMTQDEQLKFNIEHVKGAIKGIEKKAGATKKELAFFLNISISTINRAIRSGAYEIPEYIKGEKEKSHVYFPLINIALFLTNSVNKSA